MTRTGPSRLAALLFAMFGGDSDVRVSPDTPEYLAASQRARARLPEWRTRFQGGLRTGDILCVKKEFPTPDGQGTYAGVVLEVREDGAVKFDFNHPLAGQPVTFEVWVIGVL